MYFKTILQKKVYKRTEEKDDYAHVIFKAFSKNHVLFDVSAAVFFGIDFSIYERKNKEFAKYKQRKVTEGREKESDLLGNKRSESETPSQSDKDEAGFAAWKVHEKGDLMHDTNMKKEIQGLLEHHDYIHDDFF